jgi:GNAT superfamily N-acetyltransferase
MPEATDIQLAMEIFARGFAYTRGFTFPYPAERVGDSWFLRDADRPGGKGYRREEWIVHRRAAAEVDASARARTRGRFCVSVVRTADEPEEPIRADYKSAGYRLGTTETFMLHRLKKVPKLPEPFPVQRVLTQELADRLAKAVGRRQALAEHLSPDSPLRSYVVLDGQTPIGWVRSIVVGDSTWVSNMFVNPKHRRRGIGKAMLAKMLRDDRKADANQSFLLASHAGAMLYPVVGYETIGHLLLFTPQKQVSE